jgi:hypothetical protein
MGRFAVRLLQFRLLRVAVWRATRWYVRRRLTGWRARIARALIFAAFGLATRVLAALARRRSE